MEARKPAVAGQFYAGSSKGCLAEVEECISVRKIKTELPGPIIGGIVPHAGWVFSGDLAGMVFSAVRQVNIDVDTFVMFGAVHTYLNKYAAVYDSGRWATPMGEIEVDEELANAIIDDTSCAVADKDIHRGEHSIEVQLPFIQYLFKDAKIVPIMVPPTEFSLELGKNVGEIIKGIGDRKKIVCIASTDLTHYGPRYGYTPQGTGKKALQWAKDTNDQEFIDLATSMQGRQLLIKAEEDWNACGPGAAAAVVEACAAQGREKGVMLAHSHSMEVMEAKFGETGDESVGYAAIVF
ncbi:Memo-like protein [Anaerohalosphaera lusitana]|uniref:Memo-like protein n=1 Tax=Anaerohalosphaera lusitana TaxID=1936003 RepID=A0A1U9NHB0_9BACT|nr:AmmeMemoRadiSam system protein B [Anaerohalosphaera lusitana]AQT67134.1 Memo-like protein [Anaerohalosphaera lusitana]